MKLATAGAPAAAVAEDEASWAQHYANHLLASLQRSTAVLRPITPLHPSVAWAQSGLMALTGHCARAQMCPVPLVAYAEGALAALAAISESPSVSTLNAAHLLAERAALNELKRRGDCAPGGACRLLDAADGSFALSLARDEDWSLLPAWLEADAASWEDVQRRVAQRPLSLLLERGQLLGLALAANRDEAGMLSPWFRVGAGLPLGAPVSRKPPLVIELASLWAGPLCGHLLHSAGAEVIKLESTSRPDGARRGNAAFFDLLNAGKRSVALDITSACGRRQLRELLLQADIVIEGSRPRALRQLGIEAEQLIAARPTLSWIAISAYGRDAEHEQRIGYGDDAAVAAGLSAVQQQACGERMFVGDAIADPLTGLHAALVAWASHACGGGRLISLSLHEVMRHLIAVARPADADGWRQRHTRWTRMIGDVEMLAPQARMPSTTASALGADTAAMLARWQL